MSDWANPLVLIFLLICIIGAGIGIIFLITQLPFKIKSNIQQQCGVELENLKTFFYACLAILGGFFLSILFGILGSKEGHGIWLILSILVILGVIGMLIWYYVKLKDQVNNEMEKLQNCINNNINSSK